MRITNQGLKKLVSTFLVAICALETPLVWAGNVTVLVKDGSSAGIPNATVYAINNGSHGPDGTYSKMGTTDSSGNASFSLDDAKQYDLIADVDGKGPTARKQLFSPSHPHINGNTTSTPEITLNETLTGRGTIVAQVTNGTPNKFHVGNVRKISTGSDQAVGGCVTDGSGACDMYFRNVNPASADTYEVGIYDPSYNNGQGRGYGERVGSALTAGNSVNVAIDMNNGLPPDFSANSGDSNTSNQNLDGAVVKGVVEDASDPTIVIPYGFINLMIRNENNQVFHYIGGPIDQNGRFEFHLPAGNYYTQTGGGCVQGGNCYNGYESSTARTTGALDTNDFNVSSLEASNKSTKIVHIKQNHLAQGTAQLKIKVKNDQGTLIPQSWVNVWADGSPWHVDQTALNCSAMNSQVSNPGFNQVNTQANNGSALLQNLRPGNITISVGTPFSQGQVTYNGGADGEWNWGGGTRGCNSDIPGSADDLRVTINGDNTVGVYDVIGNPVSGKIVDENGVPTLSVVIPTLNDAGGRVYGTVTFPEVVDLTNSPITFILRGACGENGCQGNFGVIGGANSTPSSTYDYEVFVPPTNNNEPANYFMEILSDYWGRVRNGADGNDQITFTSGVTEIRKDMSFARAGRIRGTLYKPDGSVFVPGPIAGGGYQYADINAGGDRSWGHTQVNLDGTFTIGGLLPGSYRLFPQAGGGSSNYTGKNPPDQVIVNAGQDSYKNTTLVNGVLVAPDLDISNLPSLDNEYDGNELRGETYEILTVKAGTVFDSDKLRSLLTHGPEDEQNSFKFAPAGAGFCGGMSWPGGFCPEYKPSPDARDFYLIRRGGIDGGQYQYMTFIDVKKNVPLSDSQLSNPLVFYRGNNVQAVHVPFNTSGVTQGTKVQGTVQAVNIIRRSDFEAFGGNFDNFLKYIPVITAKDANGNLIGTVLVTPPPDQIEGSVGDQIDASVANNDYDAFKTAVADLTWGYELRGLPANKQIILVGTTPNYPPVFNRITTGAEGSVATWNINWDTSAGSGGTISGTVKNSSNEAVVGATVEIKAPGVPEKSLTTGSDGSYEAPGLPQGPYKVTVFADSYAPMAQKTVISGTETDTLDFSMVSGPGSISGTVTELSASASGLYSKPVEGVTVTAYDDTLNAASPEDPLALIRTQTDSSGNYSLSGLVSGHNYVVTLRVTGRYIEQQTVAATGGAVTGVDFKLQPKPLDIDLVIHYNNKTENFEFNILNPNNFEEGQVWYYNGAAAFDSGTATDISNSFSTLPSGNLFAELAASALSNNVTYKLRVRGVPADGSPDVVKELEFGLNLKENSQQSIDEAMAGDDTDKDDGVPANRIQGADGSSFDIEPGGMMTGSDEDSIPNVEIGSQDAGNVGPDSSGSDIYGDAVTVTFNNVEFTDKPIPFNIPFDSTEIDGLDDLALYQYNPNTGTWEQLTQPGDISVNPVDGTASGFIDLGDNIASQVSVNGARARSVNGSMKAVRTAQGYTRNPHASASGALTMAVGRATSGGVSATAYHQYNFPNPFNLKQKTVSLRAGSSGVGTSIRGTYIVIAPTGSGTADATIRVYNLAGDMVREFKTTVTRGQYNYLEWDGRNTAGDDVASGVYFATVDAPGAPDKEPIKMVLVK